MKFRRLGCFIRLNSGDYVSVDEDDYDRLVQYNWSLFKSDKWKYAIRTECVNGTQKTIYMHREIMVVNNPKIYVDHKDHDGLNNHKYNLRISDNRFNQYNVGKKSTSKQKYKNIRKFSDNKWQVRMRIPSGKRIERMAYSEYDAVKLYNELALKYHGEFAYLQEVF